MCGGLFGAALYRKQNPGTSMSDAVKYVKANPNPKSWGAPPVEAVEAPLDPTAAEVVETDAALSNEQEKKYAARGFVPRSFSAIRI